MANWTSTDYADKFDEQGRDQVDLLAARAKQISALIDDILEYSTLGHGNAEKRPIDLNAVITEIIDEINPPDHIEIISRNGLPTWTCQKTHIVQVFQNLLNNAVKYMDKANGRFRLSFKLSRRRVGPHLYDRNA